MYCKLASQPMNPFEDHLRKTKISRLPKNANRILDLGCGDGSVFDGTSYVCDGYDIDEEALDLCRRKLNYVMISNDIDQFNPVEYDCVAILGLMEHLETEEVADLLEFVSNAKNIYITVPNAESFHRRIGQKMGIIKDLTELGPQDLEIGHKRYYTFSSLMRALSPLFLRDRFKTVNYGSLGFKFDHSIGMIPYLNNIKEIEQVAEEQKLIGNYYLLGAELFVHLSK